MMMKTNMMTRNKPHPAAAKLDLGDGTFFWPVQLFSKSKLMQQKFK